MSECDWAGLSPTQADGQACVVCARTFRVRGSVAVPVGRAHTGSQVFACVGSCASEATALTEELVAMPVEALSAAGAAFLAALEAAGGDGHRAWPDDLLATTVGAAAPLVVAAELRRIATGLRARADALDPLGGESQ
jgi:hypothetical protein